ncbi:helix-turn-helix domain-containing protein [Roseateles sp. MS654]|uniref:helix-turn-helix domain-containing protein n=1 Tax=Roseateles sp. MS654 TaxID=3412685 RepID=UPI003C2E55C9
MPSPQNDDLAPTPPARELLALNVIRLRQQRGLSQEALAFEAGLHRTFVAHVERQARNISLDNIEKLALALEVPVYRLLKPAASR